jgi:Tol biopolymer transport system component
MPETRELFELVRAKLRIEDVPFATLERVRRRRDRKRKLGVFTLVAVIVVGGAFVSSRIAALPDGTHPNGHPPIAKPFPGNQIVIVGADGSNEQPIAHLPADADQVALSPDGTRLAFITAGNGDQQIATMRTDGSDLRVLTHRPLGTALPAWSPDGSSIAFFSTNLQNNQDLFAMDSDGTNLRRLTTSPFADLAPDWSPDGSSIAYFSGDSCLSFDSSCPNEEIWVVPAAGGRPTRLTRNHISDMQPAWSPDGAQIAFVRGARVWVMDADGTNQHELTSTPARSFLPRWSPDGTRIAFLTYVPGAAGTVPAAGGGVVLAPVCAVRIIDLATDRISLVGLQVASDLNEVSWVSNDTLLIRKVDR